MADFKGFAGEALTDAQTAGGADQLFGKGNEADPAPPAFVVAPVGATKVGSEFLVNTQTAGNQDSPTITSLTGGGFVVSWSDSSGTLGDASASSIKAQVFDAAGAKVGSEFLVNTQTGSDQYVPTITGLANGGFVVTWSDNSGTLGDADGGSVKAQVFNAAGAKFGNEFLVNTQTAGVQYYSTITGLANGGFVVTWSSDIGGGRVAAQVFDAAGAKLGSEFRVDTQTTSNQQFPTITGLSNGGFVVTWQDSSGTLGDASATSIKAQVFDADGAKLGGEFLVNTQTAGDQIVPTITGLTNGGFVVTWTDYSGTLGDASNASCKGQLFNAAGVKQGGEFLINTQTANSQLVSTVAELANGGFVVTWSDLSGTLGDASNYGVKAQVFGATGLKVGSEFLVNTQTQSDQYSSEITGLANGGFVITWTDTDISGDGSGYSIKAQIFSVVAPNVAPTISNLQGDVATQTEGVGGTPRLDVGSNAVITDADSANFSGGTLTVAITAGFKTNDNIGIFQDGNVALDFSTGAVSVGGVVIGTATGGYISSPASPTFSVSLNDNATPSLVQTLLRAIFVRDPRVESRGGTREITTTLSDGDGGVNSYTSQLVVTAINDEPSGTDKTITINEDAARVLTVADFGFLDTTTPFNFGEGDSLAAVFITTVPTGGTLYIDTDGAGTGALGTAVTVGQRVTAAQLNAGQFVYVPAADANGTGAASFTFQVQDNNNSNGTGLGSQDTDQSPNTLTFNITAVNDLPVVDLNGAGAGIDVAASYTEDSAAVKLALAVTLSDTDSANLTGATVTIATGFVAGDILRMSGGLSGTTASGITFGYNTGTGVLTLSGTASVADYQTALATLAFKSNSDNPGTVRDITVVVNDGAASSVAAHINITVTPINDAPVNIVPGNESELSGGTIIFSVANANALMVSDPDAGTNDIRVKVDTDHGTLTLASTAGLTVTGNGTGLVIVKGTIADINSALDGLTYQGEAGYIGSATVTLTTNDRGYSGSSGPMIDSDSVAITWQSLIQAVPDMVIEGDAAGEVDFSGLASLGLVNGDLAWIGMMAPNSGPKADMVFGEPMDFAIRHGEFDIHGSAGSDFML